MNEEESAQVRVSIGKVWPPPPPLYLLHHLLLFLPARHHPVSLCVPRMWRFVWHVSHTLCYQHLCDEHKHSLRGLAGRVGWVGVSQMVQCQGPQVWF